MPADEIHHGAQESARPGGSPLEIPDHVKGHIRETIKYEPSGEPSSTYNTPGVNPEDPYNAFARRTEQAPQSVPEAAVEALVVDMEGLQAKVLEYENRIAHLESLLRDANIRELADKQPRRVRTNEGAIEQAVVYKDGDETSYEWDEAKKKLPADDVTAGWNEFDRQRDAGMFNAIAPGEKVGVEPREESSEAALGADDSASNEEAAPETARETTEPSATNETTPQEQAEVEEQAEEALEQIEEAEAELEAAWEYQANPELRAALETARRTYARETAKSRASLWGSFLHNSTRLVSSPRISKMAGWLNDKIDGNLNAAREAYSNAVRAIQADYAHQVQEEYEDSPELRESIRIGANALLIESEENLQRDIVLNQLHQSGKIGKLADWWVRQDGASGKWKRAGIVAGVATIGVGLGAVGSLIALPVGIAGGVAGVGVGIATAQRINKQRAGAYVAKSDDLLDGRVAEQESGEDLAAKRALFEQQQNNGTAIDIDEVNRVTESRTADSTQANRLRTLGLSGAAAAGAVVGIASGSAARDAFENVQATQSTDGAGDGEAQEEAATQAPEVVGQNFTVEDGNGFTQELVEYANANGKQLTPDQSYEIYKQLIAERGPDGIIVGQASFPLGNGDYGIATSGAASWAEGVPQRIQEIAVEKGYWQ